MSYHSISQLGSPYMETLPGFWQVKETEILVACEVVPCVGVVIHVGEVHHLVHDQAQGLLAHSVGFLIFSFPGARTLVYQ